MGGGGRWKKNTHNINKLQFASEQYAITNFTSNRKMKQVNDDLQAPM